MAEKPLGHASYSRRKDNATKRLEEMVKKLVAEGATEEEARETAMATMRANSRGDWRNG